MTIFGHLTTWAMLGSVWVALAVLTALTFAVIAKVGRGRREK